MMGGTTNLFKGVSRDREDTIPEPEVGEGRVGVFPAHELCRRTAREWPGKVVEEDKPFQNARAFDRSSKYGQAADASLSEPQ